MLSGPGTGSRSIWWRIRLLLALLVASVVVSACGGGSGGGAVSVPAGGASTTPPGSGSGSEAVDFASAATLLPIITGVEIPADGQPVVEFQLTDDDFNAIVDLPADQLRLIVTRLQTSPLGGLTGSWQSYINKIEQPPSGDPALGPGTEPKLQATTESASDGSLTNNGDGTYRYRFAASVLDIPEEILSQAEVEGLDLSYDAGSTHRVAMQLSNDNDSANPVYDWQPATGDTDNILHYDVAATENCNTCHSGLALHGGARTEVEYCVTCHNPGSADANSGHSVDFKQLIHKLHRGTGLPSVVAGGEYAIWGFRDVKHDYSNLQYPRDIRNCEVCHAGTATAPEGQAPTAQGDNWAEYASRAACGSCHDDLDFSTHFGGQSDDTNCMSCHAINGAAGGIAASHADAVAAAQRQFETRILAIADGAPGEMPRVDFEVVNPQDNDRRYDLLADPQWTGEAAGLTARMAWSTDDYSNTGNQGNNASSVSIGTLADVQPNGDGSFRVRSSFAVPDGSASPGLAASGSGAIVIEAQAALGDEEVPVTDAVGYFTIDEPGGSPVERRTIVASENCLTCHGTLSFHGGNRTNNVASCVTCHNPANTDIARRDSATTPPTDGKDEQSVDFKILIHAIHAAGFRETPIQVVGFGGALHVFDEDKVRFPGDVSNCLACHIDGTYTVPLAATARGTTIDTGRDVQDPADDRVSSPTGAVCSSCHDGEASRAHMEGNGANFNTTQTAIDEGEVIEQCELCHGEGRSVSVSEHHGL